MEYLPAVVGNCPTSEVSVCPNCADPFTFMLMPFCEASGWSEGLPMKVVGADARQLRGPDGKDLYYDTSSVTLGGGESAEVMIDTRNVAPGTYFLYSTNLNFLSNFEEDNGGMMTEIVIAAN